MNLTKHTLIETYADRLDNHARMYEIPVFREPLPAAVLDGIEHEIAEQMKPMGPRAGMKMAEELIGKYPNGHRSPESYLKAIAAVFAAAPLWAGKKALDKVFSTEKFTPAGATVIEAINEALGDVNRKRIGLMKERDHALSYRPLQEPTRSEEEVRAAEKAFAAIRAAIKKPDEKGDNQ